jgi:hypothetical protein
VVTLRAEPAQGARFVGWSGDCAGTAPTCQVAMNGPRSVSATFSSGTPSPPAFTLSPGRARLFHTASGWVADIGFTANRAAKATLEVFRGGSLLRTQRFTVTAGTTRVGVPLGGPGTYLVRLTLTDATGTTRTTSWTLRIR